MHVARAHLPNLCFEMQSLRSRDPIFWVARVVCNALRVGAFIHNGALALRVHVAFILFRVLVGSPS